MSLRVVRCASNSFGSRFPPADLEGMDRWQVRECESNLLHEGVKDRQRPSAQFGGLSVA